MFVLKSSTFLKTFPKTYLTTQVPMNSFVFFRKETTQKQKPSYSEDSAMNELVTKSGMSAFLTRVYKTTGLGILTALTSSHLAVQSGLAFTNPLLCGLGGFAIALGGIIGTQSYSCQQYQTQIKGETHLVSTNSPARIFTYGLAMSGLGLSSSLLFGSLHMINPVILPLSIGITGSVSIVASLCAIYEPKNLLLSLGSCLYAGLFGLIGFQQIAIIIQCAIQSYIFIFICFKIDCFIVTSIFTAFIAYNTYIAIKAYENGNADHLGISISLASNFWNVLFRVAEMIGIQRKH